MHAQIFKTYEEDPSLIYASQKSETSNFKLLVTLIKQGYFLFSEITEAEESVRDKKGSSTSKGGTSRNR